MLNREITGAEMQKSWNLGCIKWREWLLHGKTIRCLYTRRNREPPFARTGAMLAPPPPSVIHPAVRVYKRSPQTKTANKRGPQQATPPQLARGKEVFQQKCFPPCPLPTPVDPRTTIGPGPERNRQARHFNGTNNKVPTEP